MADNDTPHAPDIYLDRLRQCLQQGEEPLLHLHEVLQPRVRERVSELAANIDCLDLHQTLTYRLINRNWRRTLDSKDRHWIRLLQDIKLPTAIKLKIEGPKRLSQSVWQLFIEHKARRHYQSLHTKRAYQLKQIEGKILTGKSEERITQHVKRALELTSQFEADTRYYQHLKPKHKPKHPVVAKKRQRSSSDSDD